MQCRKARRCARIIFGLAVFCCYGFALYFFSADANIPPGYPSYSITSFMNVKLPITEEQNGFFDRVTELQVSCFWYDLHDRTNSYLKEFKPPFQTRLPAISTVFKDGAKTSVINEISVLVASVDMCLPSEHQKASFVPAIPSQYKVFAMMELPCSKSQLLPTPNKYNKSLPYSNILAAQRAGYAGVLIFDVPCSNNLRRCPTTQNPLERYMSDQIFIPVLLVNFCTKTMFSSDDQSINEIISSGDLKNVSFSPARIRVDPKTKKLESFKTYLGHLYWWLLVGPVVTLVWLTSRRRKTVLENANVQPDRSDAESISNDELVISNITTDNRGLESENSPLLTMTPSRDSRGKIQETTKRIAPDGWFISSVNIMKTVIRYTLCLLCALACLVFPLPLGISAGGLSFIRFDENDSESFVQLSFIGGSIFVEGSLYINFSGLMLMWSPTQVMFFFIYSGVKCRKLWTIHSDISKVIRCSWFKTSIFLFVSGSIVPLCVVEDFSASSVAYIIMILNTLNTISNGVFLLILDKYSQCTLFVFYSGVCMICAYIESSVVIVIYFIFSSTGSLDDSRTTALRSIEITAALMFSFQTSIHIIRKLRKPHESLFAGLSES